MKNYLVLFLFLLTLPTQGNASDPSTKPCFGRRINKILSSPEFDSKWRDHLNYIRKLTKDQEGYSRLALNMEAARHYSLHFLYRNEQPPEWIEFFGLKTSQATKTRFKNWVTQNEQSLPSYGLSNGSKAIPSKRVGSGLRSFVFEVNIPGEEGKNYFRPILGDIRVSKNDRSLLSKLFKMKPNQFIEIDTDDVARKTMAACILNQLIGLNTVPECKLVKINQTTGVLSKAAIDDYNGKRDLELIDKFANQFSDIEAFEFLSGNSDVAYDHNLAISKSLKTMVYDHGNAFNNGLALSDLLHAKKIKEGYLGISLPNNYTKKFYTGLKTLTREKLQSDLRPFLSEEEINNLWFRRGVILEDIDWRELKDELIK